LLFATEPTVEAYVNSTLVTDVSTATDVEGILSKRYLTAEYAQLLQKSFADTVFAVRENPLERTFTHALNARRQSQTAKLYLDGKLNPYLAWSTMMGIPSTKLNFNVLLDVRKDVLVPLTALAAVAGNVQSRKADTFERLYDSHVPGIYVNRANPLKLPRTAQFPFDPNDLPTGR
jgi:hypothetical protein